MSKTSNKRKSYRLLGIALIVGSLAGIIAMTIGCRAEGVLTVTLLGAWVGASLGILTEPY